VFLIDDILKYYLVHIRQRTTEPILFGWWNREEWDGRGM